MIKDLRSPTDADNEQFSPKVPQGFTESVAQAVRSKSEIFGRDKVSYEKRHTICIPRVKNKITKQFIFSIFCNLKLGFIEKVIEIPIKKDDLHKRVLVKIKWNNSDLSSFISNRFDNRQNVKIMYSDPSYWICVPNYQGFQGVAESEAQAVRSKSAIFGRDEVSYENQGNSDELRSLSPKGDKFPRTPMASPPEYFTVADLLRTACATDSATH